MVYGYKCILLIFLLVITIVIYKNYTRKVEGYENNSIGVWSPDLIKRFNIYQTTMNNNVNQFNLKLLQEQASPEEVEELMETGYWPWAEELKQEYVNKVWSSPLIKIDPQYALNYAMSVYNERAARELLAWNTKEGNFLLYGGNIGRREDMPEGVNNTIKCNARGEMEKTVYKGMNDWNGNMDKEVKVLDPSDISKEMPGFSFVNGVCNPCGVFNEKRDFSCPFRLNMEGDDSISVPWKQLWGV